MIYLHLERAFHQFNTSLEMMLVNLFVLVFPNVAYQSAMYPLSRTTVVPHEAPALRREAHLFCPPVFARRNFHYYFNCRIRSCRNCRSGSCWVSARALT